MTAEGAVRPQSSVSLQSSNKPAVICPDPSAHAEHEKHAKLQETASAAALLVTRDRKELNANPDPKLSSASAAQSLKYAKPQDLPGFPIVGIDASSSAGKAALLAHANPTEVTWWKPGQSESASKAALLAHDYKMAPLWQPEASAAGSKAALLAHSGTKSDSKTHSASAAGSSAAGAALRSKQTAPPVEHGSSDDRKKRALLAATGAYNTSQRKRAGSTPVPVASYPDARNSAQNALSAATIVHRNSVRQTQAATPAKTSTALDAARIQNIGKNVPKEMWTDRPPVEIELEEKRHNDALRASAISMAQKMYAVQQNHINEASGRHDGLTAATKVHGQTQSASTQDIKQQAMQFIHVQEAAQRLAAERISKIKGDEANEYRDYYGYGKQPGRSRLSVRRNTHRRASSEGGAAGREVDSDDEEQSRRIRSQMSAFNNQLAEVDSKKRQKDRNALMAAAEKKVHAQMHSMDEKVFNDTGKMSQAMVNEWDAKARERAAVESEARMKNHGKVHIGGGKFMDQSEINAIAAARLQPTLDDINEHAEKQRARDEEIRLDIEERKRENRIEKDKETELKSAEKRLKDEEKQATKSKKVEEKQAARAEKDAEKARKAEEKRHHKEEKRKSRDIPKPAPLATDSTAERTDSPPLEGGTITTTAAAAVLVEDPSATISPPITDTTKDTEPTSPTKRDSGITKFLSKLKRRSKPPPSDETPTSPTKSSAFVGGSALTGARSPDDPSARPDARSSSISSLSSSTPSETAPVEDIARFSTAPEPSSSALPIFASQGKTKRPASVASSVSPSDSVSATNQEEYAEARDKVHTPELAPPPRFGDDNIGTGVIRKSASPVRGQTIFREEF